MKRRTYRCPTCRNEISTRQTRVSCSNDHPPTPCSPVSLDGHRDRTTITGRTPSQPKLQTPRPQTLLAAADATVERFVSGFNGRRHK